jgi:hypothetical protein
MQDLFLNMANIVAHSILRKFIINYTLALLTQSQHFLRIAIVLLLSML